MVGDKYVGFVDDEHFLKCVSHVCDFYFENIDEISMGSLQSNVVDPFKVMFDVFGSGISIDDWMETEKMRQDDKTINNKIGEFHQMLLGGVDGWHDLGTGDPNKVDLMDTKRTVFIELKNKHNTMNDSATRQCRANLEGVVKNYPKAVAYWAFIVPGTKARFGEKIWKFKGKEHPRIKKVWGKSVYGLVTGNPNDLQKVWEAIPLAIKDLGKKIPINEKSDQKLKAFFEFAFGSSDQGLLEWSSQSPQQA